MSFKISRIPDRLIQAVKAGHLVPFIGAGVSRQAKRTRPNAFPIPSWTDLIKDLKRRARARQDITEAEDQEMEKMLSEGKHLMVAQVLKHELGDEFQRAIQERCSPSDAEPGPIHRRLFDLKCPLILTTNYDCLLEDACLQQTKKRARAVTFKDAVEVQHILRGESSAITRPLVFKIHGSVEHDGGDVIIAESDYRKLLYREPGYRAVLSAVFMTRVVLMMGFSFSDPELTVVTESVRESLKHRAYPDYLVLRETIKGPVEKKRLLEDFGLEVIEYTPTEGDTELFELVDYLADCVKDSPSSGGVIAPPQPETEMSK